MVRGSPAGALRAQVRGAHLRSSSTCPRSRRTAASRTTPPSSTSSTPGSPRRSPACASRAIWRCGACGPCSLARRAHRSTPARFYRTSAGAEPREGWPRSGQYGVFVNGYFRLTGYCRRRPSSIRRAFPASADQWRAGQHRDREMGAAADAGGARPAALTGAGCDGNPERPSEASLRRMLQAIDIEPLERQLGDWLRTQAAVTAVDISCAEVILLYRFVIPGGVP